MNVIFENRWIFSLFMSRLKRRLSHCVANSRRQHLFSFNVENCGLGNVFARNFFCHRNVKTPVSTNSWVFFYWSPFPYLFFHIFPEPTCLNYIWVILSISPLKLMKQATIAATFFNRKRFFFFFSFERRSMTVLTLYV